MYITEKFKIIFRGLSADYRTNKWEVKCNKCSKVTTPPTTVMAVQLVTCSNCGEEEEVNYNELTEQV